MKKIFVTMFTALLAITSFNSCSKDEDRTDLEIWGDLVDKTTVTYTGEDSDENPYKLVLSGSNGAANNFELSAKGQNDVVEGTYEDKFKGSAAVVEGVLVLTVTEALFGSEEETAFATYAATINLTVDGSKLTIGRYNDATGKFSGAAITLKK
ncbi:hypothetical protein FACS189452_01830 [Bacteroidia bacterium]|nr:hypothetical protein FACS189452_01830 [Bacteroidia bacterium]GHT81437.1 hypothetical protein FACS189467_5490 [Bacteroidia bacterium]